MKMGSPKPIKDYALGIYDGPHATPQETEEGAIFLGIKNFTDNGQLDFSEVRHVSENELPRWTKRVTPQHGDVVFTYEATLHRYALIPEGFRGCLGRRVALVRPDPKKADARFLLYYFLSHEWRRVVEGFVITGATVDRIPLEKFPDFPVQLPKLSVQRRIADTLTAYDDLMENNRRRMALLEESARLLYREWFVHLRFPGHEHTRLINGVPQGWERVPLGEVMTLQRGHDLPSQERVEGDVPIVSSSGITGFHDKKKANAPGVVTGRYGTLGQVYYIDRDYWPLNTALYVTDFNGNPPLYILHLLKHALESIQSDKAAIPGLNRNVVHSMKVLCPPASLRSSFGHFAADLHRQISTLNDQTRKLRTARDLLLPRLMSGEIEL